MKLKTFFALTVAVFLFGGVPNASAQYPMPAQMGPGYFPAAAPMMMPGQSPYGIAPANFLAAPGELGQVQPAAFEAIANASKCDSKACEGKGGKACCCGWCHHVAVFGEFLYLRSRDSEVAYGVAANGPVVPPTNPPIQIAPVGVVDQDWDPGFRFGATFALTPSASITAQFTRLETNREDQISTTAGNIIRSLVSHPSTLAAGSDFLNARAGHSMTYDLIDLDFRGMITCCDLYQTNFLVGARYGKLEQNFRSAFSNIGVENVDTDISFEGVGIRVGYEGERYTCSRRWFGYGKLHGSLMAGEFHTRYQQSMSFDPGVVDTGWDAGRLVPILDLEVGAGWQSRCGTWRLSAGYQFSGWFNTVKTDEWIRAVRHNDFVDMSDTITFDGLVTRVEARF